MNTSESIKNLFPALIESQKSFPPIPKNRTAKVKTKTGGEYSYSYADISDILHAVLPILNKNGIAFSQPHILVGDRVRVATRLTHSSGEWMQSDGLPLGEFVNPQELGSSSTYMRRYDACSMLGIVAEDDSDAQELATTKQAQRPQAYQKPVTPIREEAGDAFEADPLFDENGDIIESKTTVQHREQKQARKVPATKPSNEDRRANGWISEAQEKRLIAIAKGNGKEFSDIDKYVASIGLDYAHEIPWKGGYDAAISWAGGQNEKRA